ncbi:hypothetical protein CAEBREN_16643 [Caenorhabditis brenneri]|uniref:RING-type domain-containing protein n=1 Tax=Caenorhabditis brenneri TaxID=135651 RepID=G0NS86_CAEBE|nr:hypothetical protein CAEBREN_16643 [Caenorhabditis brenneri]
MDYCFQDDITGTALKQIILKFIPRQFLKNINLSELGFDNPERLQDGGVKLLQKLIDEAPDDIRMYGSANKLAKSLQEYQLFTSSHKFFGMRMTEEYPDMRCVHLSQKNEKFISKQDLLVLIRSLYSGTFPNPTEFGRSMMMIYFKSCEEKLNGRLEFIRYDEKFINKFMLLPEIDEETIRAIRTLPPFDNLLQKWKYFLPGLTEKQYESISETLKAHFKQFPVEGAGSSYSNVQKYLTAANKTFNHLSMIQIKIDSFPNFFLPNPSNSPIVVRLFSHGGRRFALTSELNQAFASIDPSFKRWKTGELNGFIPVIYFEEIERDFAHLISQIHFIDFPTDVPIIDLPKPIITPSGSFCVYGQVASMYTLMFLCVVLKVYQKVERKKFPIILKYLKWFEKEFSEDKLQHFMTWEKFEYLLQYTSDYFKEFENVKVEYTVRDWDKEYTLDDLRSDLKHTGLVGVFPDIEYLAAAVYDEIKSFYKLDQVKSSDMFILVGLCQTTSIIKESSEVKIENLERTNSKGIKHAAPKHSRSPLRQTSAKTSKDDVKDVKLTASEDSRLELNEAFLEKSKDHSENVNEENKAQKGTEDSRPSLSEASSMKSKDHSQNANEEKKPEKGTEATDEMIGAKMQLNYLKREMKQKESEYELELSRNKRIIKELKEVDKKSKDAIQKLSDSKIQLDGKVSDLESKLDAERKKTKDCEKAAKQKEADFNRKFNVTETTYKKEISDNKKVIIDLKNVEKKSKETIQMLSDSKSRLIDKMSNLESQLKAEQQKTKKLEQAASAEQSKRQREISENERIINELSEILQQKTSEIEQLESQFEVERVLKNSLEDELANKNVAISELTNYQNQLIERNGHLESLLKRLLRRLDSRINFMCFREKQRTQELAETVAPSLQRLVGGQIDVDLEQEISEIKNVNRKLLEVNRQLTEQVEQQKMVIKSFFEHFGQVQKTYSSSSCQTTPEEFTIGYTGVKHHLWSLQKIKDSFRKGNQLEQAKEMAEKMAEQPELHAMATYELQQYEAQLHHYLQSIEVNIQKIKKTGECTHLDPIPDLPMFSDRFLKEYWKLAENKNSEPEAPPENSPEDPECLICLVEMNPEEKTTKCDHCRKVMHSECASEWLKRHRSCPHCRRELLDPNEFPPLS